MEKQFLSAYTFSNYDNNKCILLFQKGVDSYQYMNDWQKFSEFEMKKI